MLVQEQRIRARAYELWELAGQDEFSYQAGKDTSETTELEDIPRVPPPTLLPR
jgi:hypothetical protein